MHDDIIKNAPVMSHHTRTSEQFGNVNDGTTILSAKNWKYENETQQNFS